MNAPYHFPIVENCLVCKLRKESFFCALPKAALESLEQIKITSVLPKDTPVFREGESPRVHLHPVPRPDEALDDGH